MAKTYLILKSSAWSASLAQRLVLLLAGGYSSDGTVIVPVVIGDKPGAVTQPFTDYIGAREALAASGYCATAIESPISVTFKALPTNDLDCAEQLLAQTCKPLAAAVSMAGSLKAALALDADDTVVTVFSDREGTESEAMALAAAVVAKGCHNSVVYEISQHSESTNVLRTFKLLGDITKSGELSVSGIREDYSRRGFTDMETAVAVADMISGRGTGDPDTAVSTSLNYSMEDLQNSEARQSLYRVGILASLCAAVTNGALSKWLQQMRLDAMSFMRYNAATTGIFSIARIYNEWKSRLRDINYNEVYADPNMINRLNCADRISQVSSNTERHDNALSLFCGALLLAPKPQVSIGRYIKVNTSGNQPSADNYRSLSPSSLLDLYDEAFASEGEYAKTLRSACLDYWEKFYRGTADCLIDKCGMRQVAPLLSLTHNGRCMLSAGDALVCGYDAVASPLTGFAVNPASIRGEVLDLDERDETLQRFVYCYINLLPEAFSNNFRTYVKTRTARSLREGDNDARALFRNFPEFAESVPVDYTEPTNNKNQKK